MASNCATDKIIALCEKYPDLGIRISIEGLQQTNDAIRGIPDGFNRIMKTLNRLHEMGIKDIGFGTTVQDINAKDLLPLYDMAKEMGYEFATATLHNSHYFHKLDNEIHNKEAVIGEFLRQLLEYLRLGEQGEDVRTKLVRGQRDVELRFVVERRPLFDQPPPTGRSLYGAGVFGFTYRRPSVTPA